jgi:MoaA/NifB/PqqE/SkfB family radical SAM enzyme
VELTSTCPFDCVFCTRKSTRGAGQHMDFALFESLMRQVGHPERILLNSLGESMHHPRLPEAIRLARATGACTELITALCSAPEGRVRAVLEAGLDVMHVSLHTLDAERFAEIYRFKSADAMRSAVQHFFELREKTGASTAIDFSFVALERNLDDLAAVAELADTVGVGLVRVLALTQPAHRRHLFPAELDGNWLSRPFRERLAAAIARTRERHPSLEIEEPPLGECGPVGRAPRVLPGDLPSGAHLAGCYENPWETTHIRSNGDVVACGEDAMLPLGNLAREGLREIWHGEPYRELRRSHAHGQNPVCNDCPIKVAYTPGPIAPAVSGEVETAQLLWGWYDVEETGARWSRQEAALTLAAAPEGGGVRIRGLLPPGDGSAPNRLLISSDGQLLGQVECASAQIEPFEVVVRLAPGGSEVRHLGFRTESVFEPRRQGNGSRDARRLGFALVSADCS